ncbi:MAG: tRNA (adenosine(37)-N6)-threonylcarbamoyltransferase complex dimerization subunit type 1 TsaB [Myxococcota bacterium]
MKWLLAFDASTPRCVIALGRASAERHELVVADDQDEVQNQASVRLFPRIEQVLSQAGIEANELAAVACGRGPGTFTGTRVAVASAKGLAYGLGCPVVPISTLGAVAASADHEGSVLAITDARRSEVYGGLWRCVGLSGNATPTVEAVDDEQVIGLSALLEGLAPRPEDLRVVGSGVEPYRQVLVDAGLEGQSQALPGPSAKGLWAVATAAWVAEQACHPAALDAVYLRASYAEMGLNTPKRPFVKSPFV